MELARGRALTHTLYKLAWVSLETLAVVMFDWGNYSRTRIKDWAVENSPREMKNIVDYERGLWLKENMHSKKIIDFSYKVRGDFSPNGLQKVFFHSTRQIPPQWC